MMDEHAASKEQLIEELHSARSQVQTLEAAERAQAALISELQSQLESQKRLSGYLPVCASCKMVGNGEGGWVPIEYFLREQTGVHVSQGVCPACREKIHQELEQRCQAAK